MIKVYTSKAGHGKTITMLMDVVRSEDKKIAIISFEIGERDIFKKMSNLVKYFNKKEEDIRCTVFKGLHSKEHNVISKIKSLVNKYDIIAVEGFYTCCFEGTKTFSSSIKDILKEINSLLTDDSKCKEVWVDMNTYMAIDRPLKIKALGIDDSLKDVVSLKKHSIKNYYPKLDDWESYLSVVDFENRTIEEYNLNDIFKH